MTDHDGSEEIPSEGVMTRAVRDSIAGLAPTERVPKHRALALLALRYAEALDAAPDAIVEIGPKLQSALLALGCAPAKSAAQTVTPAAPAITSGGEVNGNVSTLAERRERHRQEKAARAHGA